MTTQTLSREGLRLRKRPRAALPLRSAGTLAIMVVLAAAAIQAYRNCWVEQAYAHWRNSHSGDTAPGRNIWLPDYAVAIEAKVVEPGLRNLSGITYDYDHDRLLAVTNATPMELLVLSKDGDIEQRYPLEGFKDPEGLTYLGNNRLAIADERSQRLDVVTLPVAQQPVQARNAQSVGLAIGLSHNNKGFEGVTYDRLADRLFAIKERDPRQLYAITGMLGSIQGPLNLTVTDLTAWVERGRYARDLSDGFYDPVTGHLLLLSDQSKNIVELDHEGNFVSIRSLRGHLGDLQRDAPQAEGITLDGNGALYVVSEPNLFYRFEKR